MQYDTIIIGAGSAGAILATRLTEDPEHSVLLLEAGRDYPDFDVQPEEVKFPLKSSFETLLASEHNWKYTARGTSESEIDVPRGKITGGSSSINGTVFLRGIPQDFDNWVEWGNDEWDFQNLLPYMNKLETDLTYKEDPGDFHGADGPILCRRFTEDEMLEGSKAMIQACLDAGHPYCEDANSPDTTGVGPMPMNNPDGIRWSTAYGYLSLSRNRMNLTIRDGISAKRIIFDTSGNTPIATGVEVESDGETFVVEGKEIILSAGAIGSPQLLMLSGIGPKDHLDEFGINCILDSPGVGQNLSDHPLSHIRWATKPEVELEPLGSSNNVTQAILRYTADGSELENDMIVYMNVITSQNISRSLTIDEDSTIGIRVGLAVNLALSKGEIRLNSTDHSEQPYLDFNLLDHEEDMRRCRDGIRMLVDLENHQSMNKLIDHRLEPTDADLESDETLDLWIRKTVGTGHHVSCTAKMGPNSDPMAVVDQYGKVHGIGGLRVVDASIMPECVRANINVTTMAIGERISDFIKKTNSSH
ncbi:MAG: mycofactocin system GMC family oxidoreductase MftG [Chloroflexi bacterium]|nr:mycofactocin system GMC family oxidoreductase MftG [Chloroflexota bacterium]